MCDIALELRERQICDEHLKLNQAKSLMFSTKKNGRIKKSLD